MSNPVVTINTDGGGYDLETSPGGFVYELSFAQCDSDAKLQSMLDHLGRKRWFSEDHREQFIKAVTKWNTEHAKS